MYLNVYSKLIFIFLFCNSAWILMFKCQCKILFKQIIICFIMELQQIDLQFFYTETLTSMMVNANVQAPSKYVKQMGDTNTQCHGF